MLFPQRTRPLCRQAPPFPKLCFLHLTCPARWHQLRTSAPRSRTQASGASEPRGPESPSASDPPGPQGEDAGWGSCSAPPGTQHHGARAAGPGSAGEAVGSWAEPPARRPTSQCPSLLHSAPLSRKRPPGLLSCSGFRHSQESTGGLSALTLLPGQSPGLRRPQHPAPWKRPVWTLGPRPAPQSAPAHRALRAKDLAVPPGPRVTHAVASGSRAVTSPQHPLALGLPGKPDDAEHTHHSRPRLLSPRRSGGCSQSVGLTHIWGRGSSQNCSME